MHCSLCRILYAVVVMSQCMSNDQAFRTLIYCDMLVSNDTISKEMHDTIFEAAQVAFKL